MSHNSQAFLATNARLPQTMRKSKRSMQWLSWRELTTQLLWDHCDQHDQRGLCACLCSLVPDQHTFLGHPLPAPTPWSPGTGRLGDGMGVHASAWISAPWSSASSGHYLHHYCPHHPCGRHSSLFTKSATVWIRVLPCAPPSSSGFPPSLKPWPLTLQIYKCYLHVSVRSGVNKVHTAARRKKKSWRQDGKLVAWSSREDFLTENGGGGNLVRSAAVAVVEWVRGDGRGHVARVVSVRP